MKWLGKHLMLKSEYAPLILEGKKTTTIRLGHLEVKHREFYINSGGRIIAKAILKNVEYKKIKDLTDEDARLDGFSSKEELIEALKKHYKHVTEDDEVTIITFEIVEKLDISESRFGEHKPKEIAELALKHLPLDPYEEMIMKKVLEYGSIRKAAKKLFGSLQKRWKVRSVLEKAYRKLIEKGVIES